MQLSYFSTFCFALAMIHTFMASRFSRWAHSFPEGSWQENALHLLGEVEAVFGIWSAVYILGSIALSGYERTVIELEMVNFTEPLFVFVILSVCSTKPILHVARTIIFQASRLLPFEKNFAFVVSTLIVAPLLGSLITEPAAMTIGALLLLDRFFKHGYSEKFKYAVLALLFVNVSIGGTLTHFAAPPVLMVAQKWGWDTPFMLMHFGWKAIIAILVSTAVVLYRYRNEIRSLNTRQKHSLDSHKEVISDSHLSIPVWMTALHLIFLGAIVMTAHHAVLFVGLFLFFLGLVEVTKEYQEELRLRQGLFVAFFLGGLVVLGGPQKWWLQPLITQLSDFTLYLGAIALTAVTDNAALTFLGSQVEGLTESAQYALVAGAVVGGGLTVIANAPNPIGYSILNESLPEGGLNHWALIKSAAVPTFISGLFLWLF